MEILLLLLLVLLKDDKELSAKLKPLLRTLLENKELLSLLLKTEEKTQPPAAENSPYPTSEVTMDETTDRAIKSFLDRYVK